MDPALLRRLSKLKIVGPAWEVGLFHLRHDGGELPVLAVVDAETGLARAASPSVGLTLVDVVVTAMQDPTPPSTAGRPKALIHSDPALAEVLAPLGSLLEIRRGPTPSLEAFGQAAETLEARPLVPTTRLQEWQRVTAALTSGTPTFEDDIELVFEGGPLDGRVAALSSQPPSFVLLDLDDEDMVTTSRMVAFVPVEELGEDLVAPFREAGLLHAGRVPMITGEDAGELMVLAEDDESLLLDAALATAELVSRHSAELRSGEVVTATVKVAGRAITVTASLVDEDEAPEELKDLVVHDHLVYVGEAADPSSGATIPAVVLKLAAAHAREVAAAVQTVDRLLAVEDDESGETYLVALEGAGALGVVATLDPEQVATLADARAVLFAISSGGVRSGVVKAENLIHRRVVDLDRP